MKKPLQVLLVEDVEDDARLLVCELDAGGYAVVSERVETAGAMQAALKRGSWDLVICDYQLPHFSGLAALKLLQESGRDLPFIIVSGTIGEDLAVAAMKAGAHDYLMKDRLARLVPAVERELREAGERRERRRMEAELRASEGRYRRLFEASRDGILILNADTGVVVDANPFLIERLGLVREDVIGSRLWGIASFRSIVADQAAFADLRRSEVTRFEDRPVFATDGSRICVEVVSSVYAVDHHTVMQCNFRDITDRKLAELALQQSRERLHAEEARFRALVEKAYEAVGLLDADARITYASPPSERILGYPPELLIGRSAFDFVQADDLPAAREQLAALLQRPGEGVTLELRGLRRDTEVRWFSLTVTNLLHLPSVHGVVVNYRDITEQKGIALALQHNEKYYRALTDHSLDLVTVLEADGTVRYESPSVERIMGWRQGELVGRNALEIVHPEDQARVQAMFRAALPRPGISDVAEYRCRHKDGSWRVLATIASNLLAEPAVGGIVLNSRDITERVRAEAALRASETQLSNAVKMARLGAWEYDVATDCFTFNDLFYAMLRTTAEREGGYTMPSRRYAERFVHPHDMDVVAAEIRRAIETADPHYSRQLEHRMVYADGEPGHVAVRFFVVKDERGRTVKTYGVNQDITERKEAEAALRKQQALFESLVSTIPDRLYFKDRQSRFVLINDLMAREAGLASAADAIGKTDSELFGPDHARQAYDDEQRIMDTGRPMINYEEKENWRDGRVTWVSTTKVPLRDAQGRVTGLVGISRDITERKNLEARYLQAQKMEAFGQLAGGVAHDFNNILGVMLMQLNLLQLERGLSGKLVSGLAELERYAMRGAGLTRQLLLFSRRQDMEARVLDLRMALEDAAKMLRRVLGEHIAFDLRAADEALWIEADPGMIEQVLMNLCINARDAMPDGGRLTVVTGAVVRAPPASAVAARHACLTVTDTGCGMDDATKARIFEPFFTTKPAGKGTGLGLATVYGIVQQHHGWIEVESAPGRGTSFSIYFPLRDAPAAAEQRPGAPHASGGKESVLVVEDEDNLRVMVTMALELAGYRVQEAANGPEALRRWEEAEGRFELLLTDYLMPEGLNGAQLAAQLIRAKPGLKVIITTGYVPGSPEAVASWPAGSIRLNKPFEVNKLLRTVRDCLDASGAATGAP
jgi:two-component system, cell cycle sensor histidine kinase and response regulator CckA